MPRWPVSGNRFGQRHHGLLVGGDQSGKVPSVQHPAPVQNQDAVGIVFFQRSGPAHRLVGVPGPKRYRVNGRVERNRQGERRAQTCRYVNGG
ncbi:hypothetical protein WBJ53_33125 (plasmid) [Spirosoma sp. SC4-14]|uniref:hypothetical protein n=1 Tax=Spirosoma sp. SC4-14 TaxID=3128900 RepID=UPI0030CCE3E1